MHFQGSQVVLSQEMIGDSGNRQNQKATECIENDERECRVSDCSFQARSVLFIDDKVYFKNGSPLTLRIVDARGIMGMAPGLLVKYPGKVFYHFIPIYRQAVIFPHSDRRPRLSCQKYF